jgi:AraC-like DNA-binding protein
MNTTNLTYEFQQMYVVQNVTDNIRLLMELVRLIDKYYTRHRSPAFFAEALSINEPVLNKYSRMVLGKTVYELIQEKIHHESVKLLITTDWSVKRIAYEIGYSDPCYFNRCFKKKTGITPKKFRSYVGVRPDGIKLQL